MKKLLYSLFTVFAVLYACQDEDSELGHSLVSSSFNNVYTDTCTVDISTVLRDSIETASDSICQIGHYEDGTWGKVTSSYYAEYSTVNFTPVNNYRYTFDSIFVRLMPSGHYWGDTLTTQRISIYKLTYPIVVEGDEELCAHTVWQYDNSTPLATFNYRPHPGDKREVTVRLDDSFGDQLLIDLVAEDEYFNTQEKFKKKFPGIVFVPENSGSCITGFLVNDSAMSINLHYHQIADQNTEQSLTFSVNKDYAYTGVQHDATNTPLADVGKGLDNLVHSSKTGNYAYMQGLTGYYNQIEFPNLNDLESEGDIVSVESATLYLYPERNSYNIISQLPEDIRLYITNENNVLEDYVYGSDGVTVQTGNLTIDELYGRNTYYSFDLTEFVRNNFGVWGIYKQKLLMELPSADEAMTFNQVVFANDPNDDDYQCRLHVRYKIYNEK